MGWAATAGSTLVSAANSAGNATMNQLESILGSGNPDQATQVQKAVESGDTSQVAQQANQSGMANVAGTGQQTKQKELNWLQKQMVKGVGAIDENAGKELEQAYREGVDEKNAQKNLKNMKKMDFSKETDQSKPTELKAEAQSAPLLDGGDDGSNAKAERSSRFARLYQQSKR